MIAEGRDAAVPALKLIPARPKTPRLFGANRPLESRPPTAPGPPETLFASEFGRLAGVLPGTGFIAPGFPPGAPIPVLPIPDAAAPPPIGCISGIGEAVAALCETAIACTVTFTGISSPFLKMALSNAIPIDEEESPLERAETCVTCPSSFAPRGIMILPFCSVFSVTRASTVSPCFAFFASNNFDRDASIGAPAGITSVACPFFEAEFCVSACIF